MASWAWSDTTSAGNITPNEPAPKKREKGFMTSLKRLLRRPQRAVDSTPQLRLSQMPFFSKISGSSGLLAARPADASYHGQGHHEATSGCKAPPRSSSSLPLIFPSTVSPANLSPLYCISPLQPSTGRRVLPANSSSSMLLQFPSIDFGAPSPLIGAKTDRLGVNGLPQQIPSPPIPDVGSESRVRHAMSSNNMMPKFHNHQNHQPQAPQLIPRVPERSSASLPLPFIRLGTPRSAEKIIVPRASATAISTTAATAVMGTPAADSPFFPASATSMCSPTSVVATAAIMTANASATSSATSSSSANATVGTAITAGTSSSASATNSSSPMEAAAATAVALGTPPELVALAAAQNTRAAVHASSATVDTPAMGKYTSIAPPNGGMTAAAAMSTEAAVARGTTVPRDLPYPALASPSSMPQFPPSSTLTSTVDNKPNNRGNSNNGSSSSTLLAVPSSTPPSMRRPLWRLSDYVIGGRLYKGDVSSVYKAVCQRSGYKVVLKVYSLPRVAENAAHTLVREIRIHTELEHDNILALYGVFEEDDRLVLVLERAMRGDLFRLHRSLPYCRMNEDQLRVLVLAPLLDALSYLHSKGVCHRDIKPENLLLTANWQLRMADFGAAINLVHERAVTRTGTMDYMAPEVERCPLKLLPQDNKDDPELAYSTAADVWSVGVLSYEMLVGFPPFINNNYNSGDFSGHGGAAGGSSGGGGGGGGRPSPRELCFPHFVSAGGRDFISCALAERPGDRPTAVQLLRHPWLKHAVRQHQARKNSNNSNNNGGGQ